MIGGELTGAAGSRRRAARTIAGLVVAIITLVGPPSASAALTWSAPTPVDATGGPGTGLGALVCPSATQCTAIDNTGSALTFAPSNPSAATRSTVDVGQEPLENQYGQAAYTPQALACPLTTQCTFVDNVGREVTFDPTQPSERPRSATVGNAQIAIACPSASQCTSVDANGYAVTFDPQTGAVGTTSIVDPAASGGGVTSVACPSAGQCTAVDGAGREVTFDPASKAGASPVQLTVASGRARAATRSLLAELPNDHAMLGGPKQLGRQRAEGAHLQPDCTVDADHGWANRDHPIVLDVLDRVGARLHRRQ